MRLASTSLAVHASNTANLLSEGYQSRRVSAVTATGGGGSAIVSQGSTTRFDGAELLPDGASEPPTASTVNLEDELVGARLSVFMYAANAAVLYAADAVAGTLLDREA